MATIKQPADGKYIGDWKSGERIAQSGRGATWTDKADAANGGGCYNCHQINKTELSYGNIGPSLWNYGKLTLLCSHNKSGLARLGMRFASDSLLDRLRYFIWIWPQPESAIV
jgi:hypothetical protein